MLDYFTVWHWPKSTEKQFWSTQLLSSVAEDTGTAAVRWRPLLHRGRLTGAVRTPTSCGDPWESMNISPVQVLTGRCSCWPELSTPFYISHVALMAFSQVIFYSLNNNYVWFQVCCFHQSLGVLTQLSGHPNINYLLKKKKINSSKNNLSLYKEIG